MRINKDNLERRVYRLHVNNVRRLNDTHIFASQSIPVLEEVRDEYRQSKSKRDKRYYVPYKGRSKFAKRTDAELKKIFDKYIDSELYANLIIACVSQFESFLADVLMYVIFCYPKKLSTKVKGIYVSKDVPLDFLVGSNSISEALEKEIDRRINEVFYASPALYFEYFKEITGVDTTDEAFEDYIEIKATRDLLMHNTGRVNQIYLSKAGEKARGKNGDSLKIGEEYFEHCIAVLKRVSGIVHRDIEDKFGKSEK